MKVTKRQLRRIIRERVGGGRHYSELTAHPRGDLGKNIADVDFPIVVGYEGKSEIVYNQEELDDILDMITGGPGSRANIPYSLNSLVDIEPESIPSGKRIERYTESTMKITKRQLRQIIKEEKQRLLNENVPSAIGMEILSIKDALFDIKMGVRYHDDELADDLELQIDRLLRLGYKA